MVTYELHTASCYVVHQASALRCPAVNDRQALRSAGVDPPDAVLLDARVAIVEDELVPGALMQVPPRRRETG